MKRGLAVAAALLGLACAVLLWRFRHVPYRVQSGPPLTEGPLTLRYTGISGYELGDGKTVILLDPVVTRPPLWRLATSPIRPDEALAARVFPRADFILINHSHYDHAADAAAIALRTGATVIGSPSVCHLALSRGVPPERVRRAVPGERLSLGTFAADVRRARHVGLPGPDSWFKGTIPDAAGPLWWWQYVEDETLSYRLQASGASVWFHPTVTYDEGELGGLTAGTLILGVNGEPVTAERLRAIVGAARPALILPTHYDNFFQPYAKGLALMPGLDLEGIRRAAAQAAPGVAWRALDFGETIRLK